MLLSFLLRISNPSLGSTLSFFTKYIAYKYYWCKIIMYLLCLLILSMWTIWKLTYHLEKDEVRIYILLYSCSYYALCIYIWLYSDMERLSSGARKYILVEQRNLFSFFHGWIYYFKTNYYTPFLSSWVFFLFVSVSMTQRVASYLLSHFPWLVHTPSIV